MDILVPGIGDGNVVDDSMARCEPALQDPVPTVTIPSRLTDCAWRPTQGQTCDNKTPTPAVMPQLALVGVTERRSSSTVTVVRRFPACPETEAYERNIVKTLEKILIAQSGWRAGPKQRILAIVGFDTSSRE